MKKLIILLFLCTMFCMYGCGGSAFGTAGAPTVNVTVNMGTIEGSASDPANPVTNSSENEIGEGAISIDIVDGGFAEGAEVLSKPDKSDNQVDNKDNSNEADTAVPDSNPTIE